MLVASSSRSFCINAFNVAGYLVLSGWSETCEKRTSAGQSIVTDLETAIIAQNDDEQLLLITGGEDCKDSKALTDITHFWYGLTHPTKIDYYNIFLEGADYETYLNVFDRDILTPYIKEIEGQLTPELLLYVDIGELRNAIYDKIARSP
jgi:hypothetical protein